MADKKESVPADVGAAMERAANRLHHLSMRYVGAVVELAQGRPCGMLPQSYTGLKETRDLIDLVLLTRAEINALTALCVKAGIFTAEAFTRQATEEYEWFTQIKAEWLGVEVTDAGLSFGRKNS